MNREKLLEGKAIAGRINRMVKDEVLKLKKTYSFEPVLCAVQIGDDKESSLYLDFQQKMAQKLAIGYQVRKLSADTGIAGIIAVIEELNRDSSINGIILQLPLPRHLNANDIRCRIDPIKDVEGVHPENLGKIILNEKGLAPCTACAVMELLNTLNIDLYGKEAVIVGYSEIVGKPLAAMMLNAFCTTTICHIATSGRGLLAAHVKRAEILVVAVGKPGVIKGEWIKKDAIVVDVGINYVDEKIIGDVEFEKAYERAAYITPVPGGVGPITVALLMRNLLYAAKQQKQEDKL
ncbi:MAG: bifunctional 5,10-methylenetetrahydrofolate dehydrogenase/5,10-methenyltetrahydrofolate cyclohydrolase [Candidatus Omnitrophica bacterium]|nr:bifunctional 5,10-methylenetetrahydrofolate dehydrogenase/5,10-methenyltetrahydrofolate cyclohydrolase [Candidatus Omnitrophota bacterium]